MSKSFELVRLNPNIPSSRLSLTFETRPRIVSREEWFSLTPAERLERFARSKEPPHGHPALRNNPAVTSTPAVSLDKRSSDLESASKEPDYAARAYNVRRALQRHIRQASLAKSSAVTHQCVDEKLPRPHTLSNLVARRFSTSSIVSRGRVLTNSLSQAIRALPRPQNPQTDVADEKPSSHFSVIQRKPAASGENANQISPQKVRIGSLRRKSVPRLEGQAEDAKPGSAPAERKALASLSSNQKLAQSPSQIFMSKGKQKAAEYRGKLKRTIEIWRGDAS